MVVAASVVVAGCVVAVAAADVASSSIEVVEDDPVVTNRLVKIVKQKHQPAASLMQLSDTSPHTTRYYVMISC